MDTNGLNNLCFNIHFSNFQGEPSLFKKIKKIFLKKFPVTIPEAPCEDNGKVSSPLISQPLQEHAIILP